MGLLGIRGRSVELEHVFPRPGDDRVGPGGGRRQGWPRAFAWHTNDRKLLNVGIEMWNPSIAWLGSLRLFLGTKEEHEDREGTRVAGPGLEGKSAADYF